MELTPDLRLVAPGQGNVQFDANGNWLNWYWYGYEVGVDSGRVSTLRFWASRALPAIQDLLRAMGYGPAATYFGYYVKFYSWYLDFMDRRGGRKGIIARATWANIWVPVIYSQ